MVYLYILRCADDGVYIGISSNLGDRYGAHSRGAGADYTRTHRPERMVFVAHFCSRAEANQTERRLKMYTRSRKEYLIWAFQRQLTAVQPQTLAEAAEIGKSVMPAPRTIDPQLAEDIRNSRIQEVDVALFIA